MNDIEKYYKDTVKLSVEHGAQGVSSEVLHRLETVHHREPQHWRSHSLYGSLLTRAGRSEEAVVFIGEAIGRLKNSGMEARGEEAHDLWELQRMMAIALMAEGRFLDAVPIWHEHLSFRTNLSASQHAARCFLKLGAPALAAQVLSPWLNEDTPDSGDNALIMADVLDAQHQQALATKVLHLALEVEPWNSEIKTRLEGRGFIAVVSEDGVHLAPRSRKSRYGGHP